MPAPALPVPVAASSPPAATRRDPLVAATALVLWLLLALFVVYPLAMMLGRVFIQQGQFTVAGLWTLLVDKHQLRAFGNSLLLATLVGLIGTAMGFVFAFTAARAQLPPWLQRAIDVSVLLPLVSPPFTTAIAIIFSFGPRGLITHDLLGLKGVTVYGLTSTMLSEAVTYFPIAYLTLKPLLAGIDSNVEGMAQSLGAARWRVFRTVTLPLTVPGLANAEFSGNVVPQLLVLLDRLEPLFPRQFQLVQQPYDELLPLSLITTSRQGCDDTLGELVFLTHEFPLGVTD